MTPPLDMEAIRRRATWKAGDAYDAVARPETDNPELYGLRPALRRTHDALLDRRDLIAEVDRLRPMVAKFANYLESANEIIEDDGGDEDDVSDARELIAAARQLLPPTPETP